MESSFFHYGGQSVNLANVTHIDWSESTAQLHTCAGHLVTVTGEAAAELAAKLGWEQKPAKGPGKKK